MPTARAVEHGVDRRRDFGQSLAGVGALEKVDLLFGEVERRLDQRAQFDQAVAQHLDLGREGAGERTARGARRRLRARIDQVGDRLGLRQIELFVQKSALRELARLGDAQPDVSAGLQATREQQLQHDGATVRLQFEHVLAGV